ncbi:MAG TPA: HEAT repeat domain-containing protein [Gemmataceae bacterium]|nr:HEAT repeat domain-containing protein [Gemmataceae bacterium]
MKIDAKKLRSLVKSHGLTNTRLAVEAGITRQALQVMLRENQLVEVREKTAKGLARALRLPDESLLAPDPLVGYKEAVADAHADLTFRGLGLPTAAPRSMDELFVPLRVVRTPDGERDRSCQPPPVETDEKPVAETEELTVAQCLSLHRRVLISGEPGSGKTTALRHTARACARGHVAEGRSPKLSRVPLMVGLADFAKARERDKDMSVGRFVVTRTLLAASPKYWAEVERHIELELQQGGCLVLLDGLDEVGGDGDLYALLRAFINEFPENQFVLTSRIVGLDDGPWRELGFVSFQVARWSDQDIQDFAQRWYASQPVVSKSQKRQLNQRAEELTAVIRSHRPLHAIASNPLMLTILAELHHARATLPRRRVDLYAKIVEVMLETWESSKRGARPGDPLHGIVLEAREFGWLLERLALGMQREGCILRPRWWVNDVVEQFLREQLALDGEVVKEQSERVIRYLCERTGLLVERGDGIFGFYHRSFQEYFAACGLLLEAEGGGDIVSLLRPYLFHPQWEEVVIHVAASLSAPKATSLIRVILDDPDPAGRFLRRSHRLVLRCLVDGAAVADRALLKQVFSDGEAIGESRWLGIAIECILLLNQLLVTRHEAEAQRMLHAIEETAKKELPDGDYLIVYLLTHDPPKGSRNSPPGTIVQKRLGGRQVELVLPPLEKRFTDPDWWYDEVLKSVRDPKTDVRRRLVLISLLGQEADSNDEARRTLKHLLVRDKVLAIRAECAEALEEAASVVPEVAKLLLDRLEKDKSDVVRQRCAEALRRVAPHQTEVRGRLEGLFTSGSELVRAGAATGLSRLDFISPDQKELLEQFLTTINAPAEPTRVRCDCIWALASLLGRDDMATVNRVVENCLDDREPNVSRAALHVLADAIAEGRREWSRPLVEKIEAMLMAVTDPCPHLYRDLVKILEMKEVHGGRRLERLLGDALTPVGDLIRIAFVFGSVARVEQVQDSDVDLMVIGEVRLKDLAGALHGIEQTLGRTVNPVLFSAEKFRDQYREGNPFLLDVVRKEKIFLKGSRDELTELVADRSPDES